MERVRYKMLVVGAAPAVNAFISELSGVDCQHHELQRTRLAELEDNEDFIKVLMDGIYTDRQFYTLVKDMSKKLRLSAEVYAYGNGFSEHHHFISGSVWADSKTDYTEYYWDRSLFPTLDAFNAYHKTRFEEWELTREGFFITGGFLREHFSQVTPLEFGIFPKTILTVW